jgi:tetratricopeptide (TPR) repeat protein
VWLTNPDHTESLTLLVRALIYRSYSDYNRKIDREIALQLTAEAIKRRPTEPAVLAIHAFALQAAGNPVDAWNTAYTALDLQPQNTLARIALALSYGRVGGYENALRESQQAVAANDKWQLDAQRALAISFNDLGRYQEALAVTAAAININNKLFVLYFERALYAMQIGDMDTATVAYFHVLAFDDDNVKARFRMCELSSLLGERNTAIIYCREVTELAPNWLDGWHLLGREYYLNGDFSAAQQTLNRCSSLAIAQNMPIVERPLDCWYLQGQSAEILGDCTGLMTAYNEFQEMVTTANLAQTWTYPPEGPAICATPTPKS